MTPSERLICPTYAGLQDNDRVTLMRNRGPGAVPADEMVVTGKPVRRLHHLDAVLKLVAWRSSILQAYNVGERH